MTRSIGVRDDDVLLQSSSYDDPFGRFKQIHEWIAASDRFIHVPTVLITEIQEFPECIEYIRKEAVAGRMRPEIHGLRHIDYGKLSEFEVMDQLNLCLKYFKRWGFGRPRKWYTPWGASQAHLHYAAKKVGLKLVDCSGINKLNGRYGIIQRLKDGETVDFLDGDEIFMHWWEGGARLKRVIEVARHGSWDAAKEANRELFK